MDIYVNIATGYLAHLHLVQVDVWYRGTKYCTGIMPIAVSLLFTDGGSPFHKLLHGAN